MKKLNLLFRVVMALMVLASLGLVFSAPAAALPPTSPALLVDATAWIKNSDNTIIPLKDPMCVEKDKPFLINAAVTALVAQCNQVVATITIQGPAHLDPCETPAKQLGNIQQCQLNDVWWKLICDGPGTVTVTVTVVDSAQNTASNTVTVKQCAPTPCPVVDITIIEPIVCPASVDVNTSFGIKAIFTPDACGGLGKTLTGVVARLHLDGPAIILTGNITNGGKDSSFSLGTINFPDAQHLATWTPPEVGWTVQCTGSGDVIATVDLDWTGEPAADSVANGPRGGPYKLGPATCKIHQNCPASLNVVIITPKPNAKICANCDTEFQVTANISNPCDYGACAVQATLIVTAPDNTVSVLDPLVVPNMTIPARSWQLVTWDVECLFPGPATFRVDVVGYDCPPKARQITANASVSINQVPFTVDVQAKTLTGTQLSAPNNVVSTLQQFKVIARLKNCYKGPNGETTLNPVTVNIAWTAGQARLVSGSETFTNCSPLPPTATVNQTFTTSFCGCCEREFTWIFECSNPGNVNFTVTASNPCIPDTSASVALVQELKAHLVGGIETYYQCPECNIMEPLKAFAPGQTFHVVVPVCNTGAADAKNVTVGLSFPSGLTIVGANPQNIGTVKGGECGKAFWLVTIPPSYPDSDITITLSSLTGIDENTGVAVLEPNVCLTCSVEVDVIPVRIEFIQPQCGTVIPPGTPFTIKAKITNNDGDDILGNVTATLYFKGKAQFALNQPQTITGIGDLGPGKSFEATWQMLCTDVGRVDYYVVVRSVAGMPLQQHPNEYAVCVSSTSCYVIQAYPETCLSVKIMSPNSDSFYATSQEFAVTARITNEGNNKAFNVKAKILALGADMVSVSPAGGLIGNLDAHASFDVTFTMHCTRSGLTPIVVYVKSDNLGGCNDNQEPGAGATFFPAENDLTVCPFDLVTVWQYAAAHLEVTMTQFPTTQIPTGSSFQVTATICNTGEADATEVYAELSVNPDGSVRPCAGDNGYTKFIGTLPGHQNQNNCVTVTWDLCCKVPCDSTIKITARGNDEYGWHMKQVCQSTGSFTYTRGIFYSEQLFGPGAVTGWTYGVMVGKANGLIGPFNLDTPISVAALGGGPDQLGRLVAMGAVVPGNTFNLPIASGLNVLPSEDLVFFIGHITMDSQNANLGGPALNFIKAGKLQIINGGITGLELFLRDRDGIYVKSLLNGTYCSTMASTASLPIQSQFIEPASITVKQIEANADLSISKSACNGQGGQTFMIGDMVKFGIAVMNNGPSAAANIMVMDKLPSSLNFDHFVASQGYYDAASGIWNVGDLAKLAYAVLDIYARANVSGTITNTASITTASVHDGVTTNNAASVTITVNALPTQNSACVPLGQGWNLVSLPIIPQNGAISSLTSGLNPSDQYSIVEYLNPGGFMTYVKGGIAQFTMMKDGLGYWFNISAADQLCFNGYQLAAPPPALPPAYDVNNGWNLVGFKEVAPQLASQYLSGIAGQVIIIYGYGNGSYFIVGTPGHEYLQPGLGYWIAVNGSGTIYP